MIGSDTTTAQAGARTAGLFDLRYIIALLFGFYGLVLVIMGAVSNTAEDQAKSGGINVNLWSGIVMLVVAALFALWAKWRPTRIQTSPEEELPPGTEPTTEKLTADK